MAVVLPFVPAIARAEVPPPRAEAPAVLTLDDALRTFRSRGFDLLIAEANVSAAEGDVRAAGAVPNPIVSATYGRLLGYDAKAAGPGASANEYAIGLSDNAALLDSLSGKRGLRRDVAKKALEAARMNRLDAGRVLEFQIKQQYLQVVQARAALAFAREVQDGANRTLELNKLRYPKVIDEGQLARVETAKLEADQAVDASLQDLRLARVGLAFLLGYRGSIPDFEVQGDLLKYAVPPRVANASPEALLRDAFEHRADLRAQGLQRERASAAIALAKRNRFPDIALNVQYTQTGTGLNAVQPPTLSFGVSAPIPIFYQQSGEIQRAEADLTVQSVSAQKLEAQVVSDVEGAYAAVMTSRRLVERMEAGLLERARKARDITKLQFDAGAAPLMDYLDAQRTFISTNLEYIQDLTAYWTAIAQLEAAVGMELRQ